MTPMTFASYLDQLVLSRPRDLQSSTIAVLLDIRSIATRVFSRRQLAEAVGRLNGGAHDSTVAYGQRKAMIIGSAYEAGRAPVDTSWLEAA